MSRSVSRLKSHDHISDVLNLEIVELQREMVGLATAPNHGGNKSIIAISFSIYGSDD